MPTLRINVDPGDVDRAFAQLGSRAKPAIARGLNRTADNGRTAIVRAVAKDLGLKAATVRDAILVEKATPNSLAATFTASAKRIPLIEFKAKGPEPSYGKGRGVTARLPGGAGRYPTAFITTVGNGHRGVFRRKVGAQRLPIVELRGPSIWQSFDKNISVAVDRVNEQLTKNIAHELAYALSRA